MSGAVTSALRRSSLLRLPASSAATSSVAPPLLSPHHYPSSPKLTNFLPSSVSSHKTFLTDAFQCDEAWERVLSDAVARNPQSFEDLADSLQLQQFQNGVVIPSDVDTLSHKLQDVDSLSSLDKFEPLVQSARRSQFASDFHVGTSHAIVRGYLDMNLASRLSDRLLPFKIEYGIFLDNFTSALILNEFVSKSDWTRASQIAEDLMLQEDFFSPLIRRACMTAVWHHATSGDADARFKKWEEEEEAESARLAEEEELLALWPYKPSGWFDNHFDIKNPRMKVAKTMTMLGVEEGGDLGASFALMGAALEGEAAAARVLEDLRAMDKRVAKEALDFVVHRFEGSSSILAASEGVHVSDVECLAELKKLILDDVQAEEKDFCDRYETVMTSWVNERTEAVGRERHRNTEKDMRDLAAKQMDGLQKQEEVLTYFENELQIELMSHVALEKTAEKDEEIRACTKNPSTSRSLDGGLAGWRRSRYDRYLRTLHPDLIDLRAKAGKNWLPVPCRSSTKGGRWSNKMYHMVDYHRVPWWSV